MNADKKLETLKAFILDIVANHENGLMHADLVGELLKAGYVHDGPNGLSKDVHDMLKELVKKGDVKKIVGEDLERTYIVGDSVPVHDDDLDDDE